MPQSSRRAVLRATVGAALALAVTAPLTVAAQSSAPVRLVVPYPAGGSVDTLARLLQQPLQAQLQTDVIVENRPGAGGRIAAASLPREAKDGTTVLIAPNALTTLQSVIYADQIDYDVRTDFQPVSRLVSFPIGVSVAADSPILNMDDLKAAMQDNPEMANYGTSGAGGMAHFAGLMLGDAADIDWTHVPFKGGAPLVNDLIGGHIAVGIDTVVDHVEYQRAGKLRILAIFSPERYSLAPNIPTMAEQGVDNVPTVEGWFGAFVPAGTDPAAVDRLDEALAAVVQDPAMQKRLNQLMLDVSYLPHDEFTQLQADELDQWGPVIEESGFKP